MVRLKTMRALSALDTGSVLADPMLRWMAVIPLIVALVVRTLLPAVLERVGALAGVDLGWLRAPLSGYVVVGIAPLIAGAVVGFLLLDQRDDRTLLALRVTPLPVGLYIAYRLAAPTLGGVLVTLAALVVAGGLGLGPLGAVLAALAAAPLGPLAALALVVFARNKVQGVALLKMASVLMMAPLAGLFLPPAWGVVLAVVPTFWVAQATWALQAGTEVWPLIAGSWAVGVLLTVLLMWRLRHTLAGS